MRSKFTKARQDKIVKLLREGNWANVAAAASGVAERTYYDWLEKGEAAIAKQEDGESLTKKEQGFAAFYERVRGAEAEFERRAVANIQTHGLMAQGGKELRWLLERRFPARWGARESLDVTSGGQPITTVEVVRTVREGTTANGQAGEEAEEE